MEIDAFVWSIIAGIVATALVGTALFKIINKNKTKNVVKQKGNTNQAIVGSTVTINNSSSSRNDNDDK